MFFKSESWLSQKCMVKIKRFLKTIEIERRGWQRCSDVLVDKDLTVNFQNYLFYLLVFLCIEVGDNGHNVFLNSATSSFIL